jgi:hypothetical protein
MQKDSGVAQVVECLHEARKKNPGRGWGQEGEMTQALCAHTNNKIKKEKRKIQYPTIYIQQTTT